MWGFLPLSAVMWASRPSNEQNSHISQEPETKECGLEDENAGETLSDRPLVEHPLWQEYSWKHGIMQNPPVLFVCDA